MIDLHGLDRRHQRSLFRGFLPAFFLLFFPLISLAAESNKGAAMEIFDAAYLFQVFGSLLLVFGGIFGLVFLLKKMNGLSVGDKSPIRVLGAARVGTREKILLVEAGEQQLLIGVATGNIRTLHVFDEPVVDSSQLGGTKPDFASVMGASIARGKKS